MIAALSAGGAEEYPFLICYDGIFIRDHWDQFNVGPWHEQFVNNLDRQTAWRSRITREVGMDAFQLRNGPTTEEQRDYRFEAQDEAAFLIHKITGEKRMYSKPPVGGTHPVLPGRVNLDDEKSLEERMVEPYFYDKSAYQASGAAGLAQAMLDELADDALPYCVLPSPLSRCFRLLDYQDVMLLLAMKPDFVARVARRIFQEHIMPQLEECALRGAQMIWIGDSFTDAISPDMYRTINLPLLHDYLAAVRSLGLSALIYYMGNPAGKLEMLMELCPDALGFEESKKGFEIDIEALADFIDGRCTLVGNTDTYQLLELGSEDNLRAESVRQKRAAKRNGGRFIGGFGSPVTPPTPVKKVKDFIRLMRTKN